MPARLDYILLFSTLILCLIGVIVLHSINVRDPSLLQGFNPSWQLIALLIGSIGLILFMRMDYHILARIAPLWYGVGVLLLVLVLFFGEAVSGSTRALSFGVVEFQPAEIAKMGMILLLASYYNKNSNKLHKLNTLFISMIITAAVVILVFLQPDLGTAIVLLIIWAMISFMAGIRRSFLVGLALIGLIALPVAIQVLEPYQQARLETFFDPTADSQGQGYNVDQSMIAIGSGQLFGRGLGGGTQSTLNFLPSQHTDFIFAVIAEKLGLIGASSVLILFGLLLWRGFVIAWRARDSFGALLASGITTMFLVQIVITIGMNLGIAPVTGLPLPFLAYGGTNLIISLLAVGILLNISKNSLSNA
ncbi:MAG: rod shape-determining protein RodA [Candidatus Saccharimonadales bacterium]